MKRVIIILLVMLVAIFILVIIAPKNDKAESKKESKKDYVSLSKDKESFQATKSLKGEESRLNDKEKLSLGQAVYEKSCLSCHGSEGTGPAGDWKKPLADGSYPPPPLNGTAHTWHHSLKVLSKTIRDGGIPLGGKMPAFKGVLSEEEQGAVIAYIQSLWPDEIYNSWQKRNTQ